MKRPTSLFKRLLAITMPVILLVTVFMPTLQTAALSGSNFNPGQIIDDSVFTDSTALTVADIQNFLNSKVPSCDTNGSSSKSYYYNSSNGEVNVGGSYVTSSRAVYGQRYADFWNNHTVDSANNKRSSTYIANQSVAPYVCLKNYVENPSNQATNLRNPSASIPGGQSAAQIIYNAAQAYNINPEVLIVTLQKEQGIITDDWPWMNEYRIAMGYACPDSSACDSSFYGFANQVNSAAKQFRRYFTNPNNYNYVPGNNTIRFNPVASCGSSAVNIQNEATAALYNYTPYQPNAAALANVSDASSGGSGDGCSAYGNRNFWWYFNTWFGSSLVPQSTQYIPDGTYTILNPTSGKTLDVANGSTADGADAQIYSPNGTPAQKWHVTRDDEGFYTLTNIGSNKNLDVTGGSAKQGTRVEIWSGNSGCAQKWAARITGGGLTFLSTCSGLALDIAGGSTSNGAVTQVYPANGSPAQTWSLQTVDPPALANGFYRLNTPAGLSLSAASAATGATAQINNASTDILQYWQFTRKANGMFSIRNPHTNKYLDVASESRATGGRVQIWDGNVSCAQEWQVVRNGNSTYTLRSACSGLALDVSNGATSTNGASVQIWTNNSTPAQQWTFNNLPTIPDAYYSISSVAGKVLDVTNGKTADGSRLQIWDKNNTPAQQWSLGYQGNGLYSFRNINSGRYLDVAGASTSSGAAAQIYSGNSSCAQLWKIQDNGNSTFGLVSSCSMTTALDIPGAQVNSPGTAIQTYTRNTSSAQMWTFDAP